MPVFICYHGRMLTLRSTAASSGGQHHSGGTPPAGTDVRMRGRTMDDEERGCIRRVERKK